ncbi:hypothetical protein [Maribacter polysaccharolyticus]|uniref:hypothetical protein n=1 Tax=Maribacter polysaccharolyticus TaxID=3020831 RepID=UPI00237F9453|nr:hypothetical protein [Maribacter polysaccharolyticus]
MGTSLPLALAGKATLIEYDMKNNEFYSPLIEEGFDLVFEPVITFSVKDYDMDYQIDKKVWEVRY